MLVVRHLNKSAGRQALYRGGGSIGIIGAARIGLVLGRSPDDPDELVLACAKNNLARGPASLAFRLESAPGDADIARVQWQGTTQHGAADILGGGAGRAAPALEEAKAFIEDQLANGPMRATAIKERAKEQDISDSTLQRAKKTLGVESERLIEGQLDWFWRLPGDERRPDVEGNDIDGGPTTSEDG